MHMQFGLGTHRQRAFEGLCGHQARHLGRTASEPSKIHPLSSCCWQRQAASHRPTVHTPLGWAKHVQNRPDYASLQTCPE